MKTFRSFRILSATLVGVMCLSTASWTQTAGSITGTVHDKTGAVIANAQVTVSYAAKGVNRVTTTNAGGEYLVAGLGAGTYDVAVTASGFQNYAARGVVLDVAQKARVDVALQVGAASTQIVVEGVNVAQVETQSSDLSGTITGTQISQLQLNGRNFTQLITLVPGVSNQTGQDEGAVGVYGNVGFAINGGRTEYNNWEIDGGDNMDNGSNTTLNVYPNLDAIAEFKVLTSNYGAQYGRSGSGTVEVETKSGTKNLHGDVFYFGRNDAFNARNYFETENPKYKKHDFGYTIGGPVVFPGFNKNREKTFFFFSEEWRRELVPGQTFVQAVPSQAERGGDFSDVCPGADCPVDPRTGNAFDLEATGPLPVDVNAQALLPLISESNTDPATCGEGSVGCFAASPATPTRWREELVRVDHNFNDKWHLTFRYIHDSWQTVTPTTLWSCPDGCSFPTLQTQFVGPGTSTVVRLTSTLSPTLLNEFVFSYTADHIFLKNTGSGAVPRPSNLTMTGLFPDFGNKLPGFQVTGNQVYGFAEDQGFIPWNNANPTYTYRDNVNKLIGKHSLQFGLYGVIAQKNEQSSVGPQQGFLTFDASNADVSTGNAFADLLLGRISTFQQVSSQPKYYFRYKIFEAYFQDDWRVTPRLTLNLGLRFSGFGTYREKQKQVFNWTQSAFDPANAPGIADDGSLIDPETGEPLSLNDPRNFNGVLQCGVGGQAAGCVQSHRFNPAPRFGFAWDPLGGGKLAIRGGYGVFFEHGNGNEQNVEALEATPPLVLNPSQPNIIGYTNIGSGGGQVLAFPLSFNAISTTGRWPYVQQWNFNVQQELPQHIVGSVAYVASKGTHLGRRRDINQLTPLADSANPYLPGEAIGAGGHDDCGTEKTPSGVAITGDALLHLQVACGGDPNRLRPFVGFSSINFLSYAASSSYDSLQVSLRRNVAPLTLSLAYTYSHSIDDSSSGGFGNASSTIDSTNLARARASSDFDQRHILTISYVYDLPLFKGAGLAHSMLGGWQFSGITSMETGTPFSIGFSGVSDNAGVANGSSIGPGTFADVVGNPNAVPSEGPLAPQQGPLLFNPAAFAAPRGLTFGNTERNFLRSPRRTNFDMALFKHFKITESMSTEFRAEAFNIFNHTQWGSANGGNISHDLTSTDFLRATGAHRARTLQFGLKFIF